MGFIMKIQKSTLGYVMIIAVLLLFPVLIYNLGGFDIPYCIGIKWYRMGAVELCLWIILGFAAILFIWIKCFGIQSRHDFALICGKCYHPSHGNWAYCPLCGTMLTKKGK